MINRKDFPILEKKINGKSMIYFDNSATTQKPLQVINSVMDFYSDKNSNVHRGINPLSQEATKLYESSREVIANFINAKTEEIIFTKNSTESINLVVKTYCEDNLKKGDIVVLSISEHHANIVPWLQLQSKMGIKIEYIPLLDSGELDYKKAEELLNKNGVKFLSITEVSNVLGILNDIKKLIKIANKKNIITLVDAAQSIAHKKTNAKDLNCDFLVFSGHKIFAPSGTGVLYGKKEILENMREWNGGGDMILEVHKDRFTSNIIPYKFEAGTPNIEGAIGLSEAIKYISKIGFEKIEKEEKELTKYFFEKIKKLKFIKIFGNIEKNKLPIFSIEIEGVHAHDASDLLGQEGIILRAGHHCAQPLHEYLGVRSTLRASLSFYNNKKEIDIFIKKIEELYNSFKKFSKK